MPEAAARCKCEAAHANLAVQVEHDAQLAVAIAPAADAADLGPFEPDLVQRRRQTPLLQVDHQPMGTAHRRQLMAYRCVEIEYQPCPVLTMPQTQAFDCHGRKHLRTAKHERQDEPDTS